MRVIECHGADERQAMLKMTCGLYGGWKWCVYCLNSGVMGVQSIGENGVHTRRPIIS